MTVREFIDVSGATLLTKDTNITRGITSGYCCDLLSWVMSHAKPGMAWITVQTHLNVIAVATLVDLSCVIIPEGIIVDEQTIAKAQEEGVTMLASSLTSYDLCVKLHQGGVGGA